MFVYVYSEYNPNMSHTTHTGIPFELWAIEAFQVTSSLPRLVFDDVSLFQACMKSQEIKT